VLVACWSVKGGSGTTVVAGSLALLLAGTESSGVLLVDLAGDVPAVLGMPQPEGPGVAQWLDAGADVDAAALTRLEVAVSPGLRLLPLGSPTRERVPEERGDALLAGLHGAAAAGRAVVVDCGSAIGRAGPDAVGPAVAAGADVSLLVLRPCYLALCRALAAPIRPTAAVVLAEGGRCLGRADVEDVLGVPVRAEVPVDPRIARAVDAGLLAAHVPPMLLRSLRGAA
jgi:MinD-like ATPase involved in chromosome partitioning or flagellar assembly